MSPPVQDVRRSEMDDDTKAQDSGPYHEKVLDIEAQLLLQDRPEDVRQEASTKSPYWVVKDWTNTGDPYLERTIVLIPLSMIGHSLAVYSAFKNLFRFKSGSEYVFVIASVQFIVTLLFALIMTQRLPVRSPKVRRRCYYAMVQSGFAQYGVFAYVVVSFLFVLSMVMVELGPELLILVVNLVPTILSELARARGWRYVVKYHEAHDTDSEQDQHRTEDVCLAFLVGCDILRCASAMTVAQALWRAGGYPSLLPSYGVVVTIVVVCARYVRHRWWFNMFILCITLLVWFVVTVTAIVEIRFLY